MRAYSRLESNFWWHLLYELKLRDIQLHMVAENSGRLVSIGPQVIISLPLGLPIEEAIVRQGFELLAEIAGGLLGRAAPVSLTFREQELRPVPDWLGHDFGGGA
ncbi:MAG: hypothetical protein KC910_03080 [Candidatus Eremiobacteraeota bacterium]|nr:hypothetical protein [Candidatus Eremiobacteraeota bacterium]